MRVKFLGGRRVSGLIRADGTRVAVGEVVDLPPRVVALFRAKGYQFEAEDGAEELPPPASTPPPIQDTPEERYRQFQASQAELDAREQAERAAAAQMENRNTSEPDEP